MALVKVAVVVPSAEGGGPAVDGGSSGDGGDPADGGLDVDPVTFTSCGCGAVDGTTVLLALALLVTRRRAAP